MRIVFLDIDGVLNSDRFFRERGIQPGADDALDLRAVERLDRIVDRTGAKIVVSSTWRIVYDLVRVVEILRQHGLRGDVVGETPVRGGPRSDEIRAWIDENRGIRGFVILDDLPDMGKLGPRHVRTRMKDGLLDEHVDVACRILERGRFLWW